MPLPKISRLAAVGLNFIRHHRITIDAEAEHLVIEPLFRR